MHAVIESEKGCMAQGNKWLNSFWPYSKCHLSGK